MNSLLIIFVFVVQSIMANITSLTSASGQKFQLKKKIPNSFLHRILRLNKGGITKDQGVLSEWGQWSGCDRHTCSDRRSELRRRSCVVNGVMTQDESLCRNAVLFEIKEPQRSRLPASRLGSSRRMSWTEWTHWSSCSQNCGEGYQKRTRNCGYQLRTTSFEVPVGNQAPNEVADFFLTVYFSLCTGGWRNARQTRLCVEEDGCAFQWSEWGEWSRCDVTCGVGFQFSARNCSSGTCIGNTQRTRPCYNTPCLNDECQMSCRKTPESGTRIKKCVHFFFPQTTDEQVKCFGNTSHDSNCNFEECRHWGTWSDYSQCSRSCGGGAKQRTRSCLSESCHGQSVESISCNNSPCPFWTQWSKFTCCSTTCGNQGVKYRTRECALSDNLNDCRGSNIETAPCLQAACNKTMPSVFDSFTCGRRPHEPVKRIFRGKSSNNSIWPWQASWQWRHSEYGWEHVCGATLITPQWALTAGHCIEEFVVRVNKVNPSDDWRVVLGMRRLHRDGIPYPVSKVIVHPGYARLYVTTDDLALLKLKRPARLSSRITPICLPGTDAPEPGEMCDITGWGDTTGFEDIRHRHRQINRPLMEAQVPILSFRDCRDVGETYADHLRENVHMCAGNTSLSLQADSCEGDSGGPLACRRGRNQYYLAGITSFGFKVCSAPGQAGVYAPIRSYETWIRQTIERHPLC